LGAWPEDCKEDLALDVENSIRLLEAIAVVLQAVCWPVLVLLIIFYFATPLRKFIENIGEFSFKAGPTGLEASAKRAQIEAAALLGAASANKMGDQSPENAKESAREIADVVGQAVDPRRASRLDRAHVLWVDDRPSNNVYERRSMEAMGIRFNISTSTEEALDKLRVGKYDAVISDMSRPPDNRAGYTLLDEMHQLGIRVPFVIYAGSNRPEHKAEAQARGAAGSTNRPQELFQLVVTSILGG
jgi:CheY-like chemotaxis protein